MFRDLVFGLLASHPQLFGPSEQRQSPLRNEPDQTVFPGAEATHQAILDADDKSPAEGEAAAKAAFADFLIPSPGLLAPAGAVLDDLKARLDELDVRIAKLEDRVTGLDGIAAVAATLNHTTLNHA